MAKFTDVVLDIEQVFSTQAMGGALAEDGRLTIPAVTNAAGQTVAPAFTVTAYPVNFQPSEFTDNFLIVEVIPRTPLTRYASPGVSGVYIIQIYVRAGEGQRATARIADVLDSLLQQRSLASGTITGTSSINFLGIDANDNSLFRADYQVPFQKNLQLT